MVKEATNTKYRKEVMEELKTKTSLRYLSIQEHPLDEPHQVYRTIGSSPHDVEKAANQSKATYRLLHTPGTKT